MEMEEFTESPPFYQDGFRKLWEMFLASSPLVQAIITTIVITIQVSIVLSLRRAVKQYKDRKTEVGLDKAGPVTTLYFYVTDLVQTRITKITQLSCCVDDISMGPMPSIDGIDLKRIAANDHEISFKWKGPLIINYQGLSASFPLPKKVRTPLDLAIKIKRRIVKSQDEFDNVLLTVQGFCTCCNTSKIGQARLTQDVGSPAVVRNPRRMEEFPVEPSFSPQPERRKAPLGLSGIRTSMTRL
jgi:hypothetical protein